VVRLVTSSISVERVRLQAALAGSLRGFAAPAAPHVERSAFRSSHMKFLASLPILIMLNTGDSLAANYDLEGKTKDGWVIQLDAVPPHTVRMFKPHADGTETSSTIFENEGCDLTFLSISTKGSRFSCPASAKSPLAGTTYMFSRQIGKDCEKEDVYDLYVCIKGCGKKVIPKVLKGRTNCC
jgi:hypothetical protein